MSASALVLWCMFMSANEILLHGFAVVCSDDHPEFDPVVCGITWQAGLPYLAVGTLGLVLLAVCFWSRVFTRLLLLAVGLTGALLALDLLWTTTWYPADPAYPEPAGPQLALLVLGVAAVLVALAFRPLRRGDRTRAAPG